MTTPQPESTPFAAPVGRAFLDTVPPLPFSDLATLDSIIDTVCANTEWHSLCYMWLVSLLMNSGHIQPCLCGIPRTTGTLGCPHQAFGDTP